MNHSETRENKSSMSKFFNIICLLTIEPMVFFDGLASGISQIATDQMVMYKICRGENYRLDEWTLANETTKMILS